MQARMHTHTHNEWDASPPETAFQRRPEAAPEEGCRELQAGGVVHSMEETRPESQAEPGQAGELP